MKWLVAVSWILVSFFAGLTLTSCENASIDKKEYQEAAKALLQSEILKIADENLSKEPSTVTDTICLRSAGGRHDFYSEGDYWWPDPENPDGPYIRKDGRTNPNNFVAHRKAMVRFSRIVGNLTSAYLLTEEKKYAEAAQRHLRAWFVDDETHMNPNMLYAQAIQGRHTGRGIGIIDGIHLMEVAQAAHVFEDAGVYESAELAAIKDWFSNFTEWLMTHPYGKDEMVHPNNHGTCFNMQVASYARLTGNAEVLDFCRQNFKNILLPNQMAVDGSFPLELERTKPYGYALFNLDAMIMNGMILSNETHDLWAFETPEGKSLRKGLAFMAPYVEDKTSWPYEPDVMYWENWPVAHPSFLFGAIQYDDPSYYTLWEENKHFLEVQEVIRNVPIRNPIIWF